MAEDSPESLTLRVAKAIPSDVGHGRARVPFDNDLNLKPGDIIEIEGERKTAAIVWRCRPEDANLGVIRVDGIIRKNAGVSLGDRAEIRKVDVQPCQKLVLSPVMAKQQKVRFGPGIEGFARRGLNKRPVVAGDRIFIPGMTLFAEALPFAIVQTNPKGIVQVLPDSEIIISVDFPKVTSPCAKTLLVMNEIIAEPVKNKSDCRRVICLIKPHSVFMA